MIFCLWIQNHQTQSLAVGSKCCAITQFSPYVAIPFKGDTNLISQGHETDPGTRNAPLGNHDYSRICSEFKL
jgi:hypothetical protein